MHEIITAATITQETAIDKVIDKCPFHTERAYYQRFNRSI